MKKFFVVLPVADHVDTLLAKNGTRDRGTVRQTLNSKTNMRCVGPHDISTTRSSLAARRGRMRPARRGHRFTTVATQEGAVARYELPQPDHP